MTSSQFHVLRVISLVLLLSLTTLSYCVTVALAEVTLDDKLGRPGGNINGPEYMIPDTVGKRSGTNIFHSFGKFNIETGASATFTNSGAKITNIIARVTGGASTIDGTIRSTVAKANFFLLNPSGVMFGPHASIDVMGSFHVSTADYLKFPNGEVFSANPAKVSILSTDDPSAFGFIKSNPAPIVGQNASLKVKLGKTLSIVGGDITFDAKPTLGTTDAPVHAVLTAPSGRINLASVASLSNKKTPGEVNLANMGTTGFVTLGKITFSDGAKMNVANQDRFGYPLSAGGTVVIRGGKMFFSDGGIIARGNPGGIIDVRGASLLLDNFYIIPSTYNFRRAPCSAAKEHPGTAVQIDLSGDLSMTHASRIDTESNKAGSGGNISIKARNIEFGDRVLDDKSYNMEKETYGYISSYCSSGSGKSGSIDISADNILVRNGFTVDVQTKAKGHTGNVSVHANNTLQIRDQGSIGVVAFGSGKGGDVNISANHVTISAENEVAVTNAQGITGILGQVGNASDGGNINLTTDRLQILHGGVISSVLYDEGRGASGKGTDVNINAKSILVSGYVEDPRYKSYGGQYALSSVDARVYGSGASGTGGNITIKTDNLKLENGGVVRSRLFDGATGQAGNITVKAGTIDISNLGQINADSLRGTGNSGNLNIAAQNMKISGTGGAAPPAPLDFDFTGLSTSTKSGTSGGSIIVNLAGDLTMTAGGGIRADSQGEDPGGDITIAARNIKLDGNSTIAAASTGAGDAGNIDIIASDSLMMRNNSSITTESKQSDGGNIRITAPNKISIYDSKIAASVGGGPKTVGGNITIDPLFVVLKNGQIVANAYEGKGGNISIAANVFLADPQSVVDASSTLGISGTVDIRAPISNISGLVSPLSSEIVSATALLRQRCIARIREGKYSSFVVSGRDGLPIEPGSLLPSLPY